MKTPKCKLTYVKAYDYEGLYKNGILLVEGEELGTLDTLQILGLDVELVRLIYSQEDTLIATGRLPNKLKDL